MYNPYNFGSINQYSQKESHTLNNEAIIFPNQFLQSSNGKYYARLQDDGNFVCYQSSDFRSQNAFWSSESYGKGTGPYSLRMQNDGNLVIYDRYQQPTWASNTYMKGTGPYKLVMQTDRNLVIYDSHGTATWSSNTYVADNFGSNQNYGSNNSYPSFNNNSSTNPQNLGYWDPRNTGSNNYSNSQNYIPNNNNSQNYIPTNNNSQNYNQQSDTLECQRNLITNGLLVSKNGRFYARLQDDGNFVCYGSNNFSSNNAFWASNTGGVGMAPFKLIPQEDGNLCLYDSSGKCTWSSNTWKQGTGPFRLVMQDDRNLVLYDRFNQATWASGTNI